MVEMSAQMRQGEELKMARIKDTLFEKLLNKPILIEASMSRDDGYPEFTPLWGILSDCDQSHIRMKPSVYLSLNSIHDVYDSSVLFDDILRKDLQEGDSVFNPKYDHDRTQPKRIPLIYTCEKLVKDYILQRNIIRRIVPFEFTETMKKCSEASLREIVDLYQK